MGVGFKDDTLPLAEFTEKYDIWQKADKKMIKQLIFDLMPPIFLSVISDLYRVVVGKTHED